MNNKKYAILSISFLFFLSALIMLRQLTSMVFFSCFISDTFTHTSWAWQFTEALKEGIVYPRWIPLNFWGYGSPTFILYPPLAFYLVAFFNIFTGSVIAAMNITKFTALFLSATGMFFFVKEFYSEKIALLTASFYILFPYNIFWIYLGASFATPLSLIWFSPILLFIYKYSTCRKYQHLLYAGAFYGGLILTHLITAYMFTFVIVAFIYYMSFVKKYPVGVFSIFTIISVGILISAAYFLPLFYEGHYLNLKDFGEGFVFSDFFVLPNHTHRIPESHFWTGLYKHYIAYTIFFCISLIFLFLQFLKLKHFDNIDKVNFINKFFFGVSICSIFFLFGVSTFLWEIVPFFKNIQYPVRWLTITYFALIFLSSLGFYTFRVIYTKWFYFFIAILFFLCSLLDYRYIHSANVFAERELIPVKAVNWASEHSPVWVDMNKISKDNDPRDRLTIITGKGEASIKVWKSAERIIEIAVKKPLILKIRTFNFPGWKAYLDGTQTEIRTTEGEGSMLIDIPEGKHILILKFQDTPIRYYSKFISLISFSVLILTLILLRR